MIDPQFEQQLLKGVAETTGMKLIPIRYITTNEMTLDRDRRDRFLSKLIGPYQIDPNYALVETAELRVFINYTRHADSPRRIYVQFLVTDCEGDFLSETAHPLNTRPTNFEIQVAA